MSDHQEEYTWDRTLSADEQGLWWVNDWKGRWHHFTSEADQLAFIDRDKRMIADASRAAMADVTTQFENQSGIESDGEQAADTGSETEAPGAPVGGQGNRQTRRRARRATYSKKASGRRGKTT